MAKRAVEKDEALEELKDVIDSIGEGEDDGWWSSAKAMMRTTQAVDIVRGGVKVNALPERASVVVNHRIGEHR